MSLLARRRAMMGENKKAPLLPSAYQQVEWIKSNGNQRISFPFRFFAPLTLSFNIDVVCKPQTTSSSEQCIVGWEGNFTCDWQNGTYTGWKSTKVSSTIGNDMDTVAWTASINRTGGSAGTISIFSYKELSSTYPYTGRLNRVKIYCTKSTGGTAIDRDLYACYRKADGVIGMYDIVNDVFYPNSGTGTFTKGADVT